MSKNKFKSKVHNTQAADLDTLFRLNKYIDDNDMESLKKELDIIEQMNVFIPGCLGYYMTYYWNTYNLKEVYPYLIKYAFKTPVHQRKRSYFTSLRGGFSTLRYEEVVTEEEYIDIMVIINNLSAPDKENTITLKNNHFFKDLKVGLISSDFRPHPVGRFILALIKHELNYQSIQYYAYDTAGGKNPVQAAISSAVSKYYNVADYDDDALSNIILSDEIDILIDLNGISQNCKLDILSRRIAPIQMSYIGFPGTTAQYNIDYTIVDKFTDPEGVSEKYYTEKLLYMDHSFLCYNCETSGDMVNYEPPCIKNGYITIGSFANPHKYSDKLLKLWKTILDNIPNSRLLLQSNLFISEEDIDVQKKRFLSFDIDVNRICFLMYSGYSDYFNNYNKVDFILDTYPFNGATTTCDALSMSVPVITLAGETHVSRVSLSMLVNLELGELIAYSGDEYINIAVSLSNDFQKMSELRKNIRTKFLQSPLTDNVAFKIELENKLREVYINYIINSRVSKTESDDTPLLLARESLTSAFYLKYLNEQNKKIPEIILKEASLTQAALCNFLKTSCFDKPEVKEILNKYANLSELLSKEMSKESLALILNSILKIINMFIG